jgi:hypothetical protein
MMIIQPVEDCIDHQQLVRSFSFTYNTLNHFVISFSFIKTSFSLQKDCHYCGFDDALRAFDIITNN